MKKLEDVIQTEYGTIEIYSQDEMAYFFQEKMPEIPKPSGIGIYERNMEDLTD